MYVHMRKMSTHEFPFLHTRMPSREKMFANLITALEKQEPASEVRRLYNTDYFIVDGISNLWSERERLMARVNRNRTLYEVWANPKDRAKILAEAKRRETDDIRDTMSAMQFKECNTFNPMIMGQVFANFFKKDELKNVTVLDPSAGWGDRLITALALGVGHYIGFDPNTRMHPIYEKIVTELKRDTATTFYTTRFKKIKGFTVDVVLTSPPFYDYEIYPGTEKDTQVPYAKWLREMYTPYIKDAIGMLHINGIFCIYVDNRKYMLADDTARIMRRTGMQFVCRLAFYNDYISYCGETHHGKLRSMWVWKRVK